MNIFQLAERYSGIGEAFEVAAGDELSDLAAMFIGADGDLEAKLDAYCGVIGNLEAVAKARHEEGQRLAALAAVDSNAAKRMRETLIKIFDLLGMTKRESPRYKVGVRGNGGKAPMDIPDAAMVPPEWMIPRLEINRDKIRAALEAGELLEFAELQPRGRHISIR